MRQGRDSREDYPYNQSLSLSLKSPVKLNPHWLWNMVWFALSFGQRNLLLLGPKNYSSVS